MAFAKYSLSGILAYALPLYAAPVLAGASAAPWGSVPVFALLFAALIVLTRRMPDEAGALTVSVLVAVVLNTAVTCGLFALGRGVAVVAPLVLPLWVPLAICAGAAAFGIWRYRWTPEMDEMEALLDEAIRTIEDGTAAMTAPDTAPPEDAGDKTD